MDSGADVSMIPLSIAELLGLDLNEESKFQAFGIGGKVDALETKINITVQKGHENHKFQIPIKIILGNYDLPILLGRLGFFDKFIISFNQSQEKISLKSVHRPFS